MKPELLSHLVCPECQTELSLGVESEEHDQIREGDLSCGSCRRRYPIKNFVPRFVDSDRYAGSFSKQREYVRRHFEHYRNDRSGDNLFLPTTGFDRDAIKGQLLLEAGCGYGRFVDTVNRMGCEIIGVDLSTNSIELAQDFVGLRDGVHLVQCDLFSLPFRNNHFPFIYSIGVLHHTPDTKAATDALIPYLAPGGRLSIWVYPPELVKSADRWRKLTCRLPDDALYYLCICNQVLFSWIRALPGGWRFSQLIPGYIPKSSNTFWQRVLGDFDTLSPTYAHAHTPEQVVQWLEKAGLSDVKSLPRRTSVTGVKAKSNQD